MADNKFERQFEGDSQEISLSERDFADDLGMFGVEDAKTLGKSKLDEFLNSNPSSNIDTTKITKVDENDNEPSNSNDKSKKTDTTVDKNRNRELDEEEKERKEREKTKALNSWLNDDEEDLDESNNDSDENESKKSATKQVDKDKDKDTKPTDSEDETFSILSKDLFRLGVFSADDEDEPEIKTGEEFLERFQFEAEKRANDILENFINRYGEEHRNMFESVFIKGVDPKTYLSSFNKIDNFKDLDISKPDIQEKIFFEYYRDQGLSEERIAKKFERSKDLGELTEDVKDMHELLLAKEEKNLVKLEQEKQEELNRKTQREKLYQQNIGSILQNKLKAGDFDGIPVTQKEAQDTYSYMTQKPYRLPNGELITEMHKDWLELDRPENHELKVKVALLLKNKMDLSKVVKKAISKNTNGLWSDLTGKNNKNRSEDKSPTKRSTFFE